MPKPPRKPARPTSSRAAVARSSQSAVGFSVAMVHASFVRPVTITELVQRAQEERYQRITRSVKVLAKQLPVTRQDGSVAYHAQTRARAELKYRAQTNAWQAREKAAVQYFAAKQTYITRGQTAEENKQGRALATQQKIARNVQEMVQNQPEATGIGSGIVVGMTVAGQVVGPELAMLRIASTARYLGGARAAMALERVAQGLSYKGGLSGPMTWRSAQQAVGVFASRAGVDGALQYTGALLVTSSKPDNAHKSRFEILQAAYSEVSISSMFMAGLPGETMWHSLRNAAVSNAIEWKLNSESMMTFKMAEFGTGQDIVNYGQKIGFSVGADYLAGRYTTVLGRAFNGTRLVRPIGSRFNPHALAEWRQTRFLINTMQIGQYPIKVAGGVVGSFVEPLIVQPEVK